MKANYISDAVKILLIAAATIITCIIVWLGFSAMNMGREISKNAISQMAELNNDIRDSGIMKFDSKNNIAGSEIVNFIKQYLGGYKGSETGPFYITVIQGSSEYTYTNGNYISNIRSFTDGRYIDPMAAFSGNVIKNTNGVIIGVKFIKQ